ncbi:MAG: Clp protease N-terminal domain-containing protein [Planctomycetota bacterium]
MEILCAEEAAEPAQRLHSATSTVSSGVSMFDRCTHHARRLMSLAREEVLRFNHDYIGTEHILLGLIEEGSGVAVDVLKNLDVDLKRIRQEVEKRLSHGTTMVTPEQLPFTPRAKKVLELALEEASNLGHNYIGSEHLLLGLIREREGLAGKVLREMQVRFHDAHTQIVELVERREERGESRQDSRGPSREDLLLERIRDLEERVRKLEEKSGG